MNEFSFSQTTELLALINLAELGTYMDIEEEALLTALEDFEQALKDFDRLLRALVISISKLVFLSPDGETFL